MTNTIAGVEVKIRTESVVEVNAEKLSEMFANTIQEMVGFKPTVLIGEHEDVVTGTEVAAVVVTNNLSIDQVKKLKESYTQLSLTEEADSESYGFSTQDFHFALELIGETFGDFNGYKFHEDGTIDIRIIESEE